MLFRPRGSRSRTLQMTDCIHAFGVTNAKLEADLTLSIDAKCSLCGETIRFEGCEVIDPTIEKLFPVPGVEVSECEMVEVKS